MVLNLFESGPRRIWHATAKTGPSTWFPRVHVSKEQGPQDNLAPLHGPAVQAQSSIQKIFNSVYHHSEHLRDIWALIGSVKGDTVLASTLRRSCVLASGQPLGSPAARTGASRSRASRRERCCAVRCRIAATAAPRMPACSASDSASCTEECSHRRTCFSILVRVMSNSAIASRLNYLKVHARLFVCLLTCAGH